MGVARREAEQVVVVTGASAGLGRAIARKFAARGASLGLLARGRDRLEATRAEVERLGGRALVCPTDVADADGVEEAAEAIEREFGRIDVWINNAMTSVFAPIADTHASEFRRVTEVTYLGFVHGTLSALRRMRPRNDGIIIQVGSALAHRSIPLQAAYCAAKHAIKGFTESLLSELLHEQSRIRVTMVHMPALNTPQFDWVLSRLPNRAQPVPPIFQPEVGADAVAWAVDHDAGRELWVAWPTIKAILGERLAAGYIDRKLAREGFEAQQTGEARDEDRPHNLWKPVAGDWAADGRFGDRARPRSIALLLRQHRDLLGLAGAGLAGLALGLRGRNGGVAPAPGAKP